MLRDVFYYGQKPNAHPREKPAQNLEDARQQSTTEHFWIINEFCDYVNFDWDFDFDFLDDDQVWTENHNNIWPSQHQKDSGTWLCSKNYSDILVYRTDVIPVKRKNIKNENWKIYENIDELLFDFSWHPDPTSPPYIYSWGCRFYPPTHQPVIEYVVPNSIGYKYMEKSVELLPNFDNWKILDKIDTSSFDFSWKPDPTSPPYIYVWGNQHYPAEVMPTIEYHVKGAVDRKYIDSKIWHVKLAEDKTNFEILENIKHFDFTWRPDPNDPPFIYTFGNQHYSAEEMPTVRYVVKGATEIKYINDIKATLAPDKSKFKIIIPIDESKFDFSWRPHPKSPPYIYVFGNQWNNAEIEQTVLYEVEGSTQVSYLHNIIAHVLPNHKNWNVLIPVKEFDYSWRPNPTEPPYIYVFGNQWNVAEIEPTLEYVVPNATDKKYIQHIAAIVAPNKNNWQSLLAIDENNFDYSWRPNPNDPPYIYVFGNQHYSAEKMPTITYTVEAAVEKKYINDIHAKLLPKYDNWHEIIPIDKTKFDFSWIPDPYEPPYIYVFGNKWNDANTEPTIVYITPNAIEKKYMNNLVAVPGTDMSKWSVSNPEDFTNFDFSWRPNPFSPPQIYQWENNGPRYTVPYATDVVYMKRQTQLSEGTNIPKYYIKTNLDDLVKEHSDEVFWALNPDLSYDNFDFSWQPDDSNFRHINVFGNELSKDIGTYFINGPTYTLGYKEYNYVSGTNANLTSTNLSMFFIDRGNINSDKHYKSLLGRFPNIIKTRYLNSWADTITRCIKKSKTKLFWILNSELDYSDFNFDFYPSPWQMNMIHVFGTQWSHWGQTYLINSESFLDSTKYIKTIEHLNCLNFVKGSKIKAVECLYDIYIIDFSNDESKTIIENIRNKFENNKITIVPYNQTYLKTLRNIVQLLNNTSKDFIWICGTICDYSNFDFSYICDPFAKEQLHVFPSNKQQYGDTFLINIKKLKEQIDTLTTLDEYQKINFNSHQRVKRLKEPAVIVQDDTLTKIIKTTTFNFPYITFKTFDNFDIETQNEEPMSLWEENNKSVTVLTTGGSCAVIPKETQDYLKKEIYDYPYIVKNIKTKSKPLDIVFLSNGEKNAEANFDHLLKMTRGLPNRVVRVNGINGRTAAYHAAAKASTTTWFFTVFAKLKVQDNFDWFWQPDRLRQAKHYIFYAENPLNGLLYGHQAMIAYNKNLTLQNQGKGLDFTLDDPHDIVPITSGIAEFNTDAYSTWRTAFREVIKLKSDTESISQDRLNTWLEKAQGTFAQDCLQGARDGVEYYDSVQGDIDQLKYSYEWSWLQQYYNKKYK